MSLAGPPPGRIISNIWYQSSGRNALIIRPALLITERELTASTCLGAERSFPVALLRELPFQFNSVLTGYLCSIKRSAGGWGRCFLKLFSMVSWIGLLTVICWVWDVKVAPFFFSTTTLTIAEDEQQPNSNGFKYPLWEFCCWYYIFFQTLLLMLLLNPAVILAVITILLYF